MYCIQGGSWKELFKFLGIFCIGIICWCIFNWITGQVQGPIYMTQENYNWIHTKYRKEYGILEANRKMKNVIIGTEPVKHYTYIGDMFYWK
jgi:hypothetical protein